MGILSRQFVEQDACAGLESAIQAFLLLTSISFEPPINENLISLTILSSRNGSAGSACFRAKPSLGKSRPRCHSAYGIPTLSERSGSSGIPCETPSLDYARRRRWRSSRANLAGYATESQNLGEDSELHLVYRLRSLAWQFPRLSGRGDRNVATATECLGGLWIATLKGVPLVFEVR